VSWHPEILGRVQRGVLRRLGPTLSERGFYLAGGAAIALYLGHRRSVDLDWFTGESLPNPLRLAHDLQSSGLPLTPYQIERGTLHATMSLLQPLVPWPEYSCSLASLDDLCAMKLSSLAQRGSRKDFIDIYALAREHKPLSEMLQFYRRKYAPPEIGHLLYSLTYFDEADRERSPVIRWDVDWRTIRRAIQQWVRDLSD
jgi:hypothetical protein